MDKTEKTSKLIDEQNKELTQEEMINNLNVVLKELYMKTQELEAKLNNHVHCNDIVYWRD